MGRWFVNKYSLPTSHDCFTAKSWGEWVTEMYGDLYLERDQTKQLRQDVGARGFAGKDAIKEMQRLDAEIFRLNKALGDGPDGEAIDPLAQTVDAKMSRGEDVGDLNALLPKGYTVRP